MIAKALEIRDCGTFIPALAVDMNPSVTLTTSQAEAERVVDTFDAQHYLLRRCGYPCDGRPNVIVTRLDGNGQATNDPYGWPGGSRTFPVAHEYIIEHWAELKDGDVVDVQFILGETDKPKLSEKVTAPL